MTPLVLTAHGSKDPRAAANARAVAGLVARMRPGLDVRLAFCELNAPSLVTVLNSLSGVRKAVVTPLLLANAYHARFDIPGQIASCATAERNVSSRPACFSAKASTAPAMRAVSKVESASCLGWVTATSMVSSVSDGDCAVTRHCKIVDRKPMLSSQRGR